ncbi:hypothetical protein K0M31_003035, partial [Melipona bicolor]
MQRIVEFVLHDRAMLWWLAKVASISSISTKKLLGYAYTVKRVRRHTTHTSRRCRCGPAARNGESYEFDASRDVAVAVLAKILLEELPGIGSTART